MRGCGKDIGLFPGIKDHLNDLDPEGEDKISLDGNSSKNEPINNPIDELDEETLSVSSLNYAMEMSSPPKNPYRDLIFDREFDLKYGPDFSETEKAELRKANNIISCAGSPPPYHPKK